MQFCQGPRTRWGERLVLGNLTGLGVLHSVQNLKEDNKRSRAENSSYQERTQDAQSNIETLKGQVRMLITASEGYMDIRARFLDIYKHDWLRELPTPTSRAIIPAGNAAAHKGDAVKDAMLYDLMHVPIHEDFPISNTTQYI